MIKKRNQDRLLLIFLIFSTTLAAWLMLNRTISDISIRDIPLNALFYEKPSDGIVVTRNLLKVSGQSIKVTLTEVDTQKASLGISSPTTLTEHLQGKYFGLTLDEYATLGDYLVVQSGGFLSSWSPPTPLGYVKIQGKEINPIHESWVTTGVFCTNGNAFEIFEYTSPDNFKEWRSCIQAGPLVIKDGEIVLNTSRNTGFVTKETHRQSFLCKNKEGNLIMGITDDVKLVDFAPTMQAETNAGGLGCQDAVLLTSKGIAGILVRSPSKDISFGNIEAPIPTAIIVRSKKSD